MNSSDPFQDLVNALRRTLTSTPTPAPPASTSAIRTTTSSPSVFASPMARPFSGLNKQALISRYRQGLDPRVRLHLAAYEDSIGLEKFIQLSIRFATRMQLCIEEHQNQQLFPSFLHQPESVSSPEPASYEMQFDRSRLSPAERQRRLTQSLCLYCGLPGHYRAECPTRPVRSMVSVILPTLNHQNPLTIIANLTAANVCIPVNAFINSGSAGNFISGARCRQLNLKTVSSAKNLPDPCSNWSSSPSSTSHGGPSMSTDWRPASRGFTSAGSGGLNI
ncbi:Retrotransposon-derived protein PEG10 [Anabarilius grahami]|uniref:Retrotransposon-derived protein PEG10 n=1 Tax=Anabarilius grahami TaxID=495550 RepID=A0A3N0Y6S2_ANAGA|nr:Retrotransposon-derived protein PEG10 [Anabarilius grahami]